MNPAPSSRNSKRQSPPQPDAKPIIEVPKEQLEQAVAFRRLLVDKDFQLLMAWLNVETHDSLHRFPAFTEKEKELRCALAERNFTLQIKKKMGAFIARAEKAEAEAAAQKKNAH